MPLKHIFFVVTLLAMPFLDFPGIGGGAYVKPLALLLAGLFLPFSLFSRNGLRIIPLDPAMRISLFLLAWVIIGDAIFPWLIDTPRELKGQRLTSRIVRDFIGFLGGFIFWLYIRSQAHTSDQVVNGMRWALRSFWIITPFAFIQILAITTDSDVIWSIDTVASVVRTLQSDHYGKIFGVAPEASMLADQLLTIYLPLSFSSIITKTSLFKNRMFGLRIEAIIFGLAILFLVFTLSRIGLIALLFLVVCGYSIGLSNNKNKTRSLLMLFFFSVIGAAILLTAGTKATQFFSSFSGVDDSIDSGIWSNVTRMASMLTGFNIALHYPLGIGTGAFPFMFERYVPEWGLASPEIQALLGYGTEGLMTLAGSTGGDIDTRLPDAKCLPSRIAAELGLPGLALFALLWIYAYRNTRRVFHSTTLGSSEKTLSLGLMLSLLTMLPLSFNINSYIWVHWIFLIGMALRVGVRPKQRTIESLA